MATEATQFEDDEGNPLLAFALPGFTGVLLVGGTGGWSALMLNGPYPDIRVRLEEWPSGGGVGITGIALLAISSLTAADLRSVPLIRLQALLDHPVWAKALREAMAHARREREPDLAPDSESDPDTYPRGGREVPPPPQEFVVAGARDARKPEAFYADVAAAWSAALAAGHKNPAAVLATSNGVEETSIHRWVRVARAKGILAPSARSAGRSR